MKIVISETVRSEVPNLTVIGKTLLIDGEVLDFSVISNGATVQREDTDNQYFKSAEVDNNGNITIEILFPYNANSFPKGKTIAKEIEVVDGVVNPYVEIEESI